MKQKRIRMKFEQNQLKQKRNQKKQKRKRLRNSQFLMQQNRKRLNNCQFRLKQSRKWLKKGVYTGFLCGVLLSPFHGTYSVPCSPVAQTQKVQKLDLVINQTNK